MKPVKIGLLGLGTVGAGVVDVLYKNAKEISRRAGQTVEIAGAFVRNTERSNPHQIKLTTNAYDLINDPEISVIVEVMGGYEPAKEYIYSALQKGKHIVTANKALIATEGNQIFELAQQNNRMVAFEAAVGGGIPIIKTIREGLSSNKIEWLAGIINGTGNFILTEMKDKKRDFQDCLKEAQSLGYAEADPTFDVEGIDAAHKLTILSSIAFGVPLQFNKVFTEGITQIESRDVNYAEQLGYHIKHLGIAKRVDKGLELRVHPTLITKSELIANVNGVMNAVLVKGNAVGSVLSYGPGAGANPTASAVVADLIDVVRTLTADPENRVPHLAFQANSLENIAILPASEFVCSYYLRMDVVDKQGVLSEITAILDKHNISIEEIIQKKENSQIDCDNNTVAEVVMITHQIKEDDVKQAIKEIETLNLLKDKVKFIRIELFS